MNIATYMDRQVRERPDQAAVIDARGRRLTFGELGRRIDAYAHGYRRMGLQPGDRVSVFVKPGLEFPAVLFSLFKAGCSPVLIDPGMGKDNLLSCVQRMQPKGLVAISMLHAARPFLGDAFDSVRHNVTDGAWTWYWGGQTLRRFLKQHDGAAFETVDMDPDAEAAILFTSGSTGPPKGVLYTHRIYCSQTEQIQAMYGIQAGEIDVPGLPAFGLFSMAMGCTVVVPDLDARRPASLDPSSFVRAVNENEATMFFGSPAILKPIARYCLDIGETMPTLKRVLSAGAAIPVQTHLDFQKILSDGVEIHTPYGATESLPVASIATREILEETAPRTLDGAGTCVGRLAPEITVRVIRITDEAIPRWSDALVMPDGEIGEICVKGPVVTREYRNEPEQTRMAKIYEGADGPEGASAVWHRIGDLGYLGDDGRLWFCGRKSQRLQTADGLMCTVPSESIFDGVDGVFRSALVGVGEAGAQEPVLIVEMDTRDGAAAPDPEALTAALLALAGERPMTEKIRRVLYHPGFPVDVRHNAKIKRGILRDWATAQLEGPLTEGAK